MKTKLLRFKGAVERDLAIDAWMKEHVGELGAIAQQWFEAMRECGDEVRELLHDGRPAACLGDAPFAYVNVFTSHVNVGFFHGAALPDPAHLLQSTGKFMRHVKLRSGTATNAAALSRLIDAAYSDGNSKSYFRMCGSREAWSRSQSDSCKTSSGTPKFGLLFSWYSRGAPMQNKCSFTSAFLFLPKSSIVSLMPGTSMQL
jgi:hypothetical protein